MPDPYFQPADPMASRRPYSWQTDEFQTKTKGRQRATVEHFPGVNPNIAVGNQALAHQGPRDITGNYRCPNCGTHYLPVIEKKISTAGGLTSGIDLALHVVERYFGREVAQTTATYMEYQSKGWIV